MEQHRWGMADTREGTAGESQADTKSGLLMLRSFVLAVYGIIAIMSIGLVSCPAMGQGLTQKRLTEADYGLWGTMGAEQISSKGEWASYRMSYEPDTDTLFVLNTQTHQRYFFAGAGTGKFNGERTFACQKKEVLVLFDLKTREEKRIPAVERYDFSADGHYLVTLEKSQGSQLVVRKDGQVIDVIANVTEFRWNDTATALVYAVAANGIGMAGYLVLERRYAGHSIVAPTSQTFKVLQWQHKGKAVVFFGVSEGRTVLYHYDSSSKRLDVLKSTDPVFPASMEISPDQNVELTLSRDGEKVFFGITAAIEKENTMLHDAVEVWHANDKMIYPKQQLSATVKHPAYLAVWYPERNVVRQISTAAQTWVMLSGKQDYALVASLWQHEPKKKWFADLDYDLLALETGRREPFLKQQSGFSEQMGISPDGRYINYYKESNWWVYDIQLKTHTNGTKGLGVSWDNRENDPGNELKVWGQPGWTADHQWALYYDYNDIWAVSADGLQRRRLTHGREKQFRFRFDASAVSDQQEMNYRGRGIHCYDLSKKVLLTALDLYGGAVGYYMLEPNKTAAPIVMENSAVTKLQKAKESEAFIYMTQRFDHPPCLMFQKSIKEPAVILAQSNPQQALYQWGKSEMIHYTDSKGRPLNGALFYPAGYDPSKRYPMVVYIYETVSRDINSYVNPTLHNSIGFTTTNLTVDGYAVLLADIAYEKGNTGFSAVDCVTKAAAKVIDMGIADAGRIGLMGHSFGGYETNFIITQTDMFATAISGSGVSDTIGHYFTINSDDNTPDGWRYENQQYRMGVSFFENQEAYYRNSPLFNAGTITTPLLTWAGRQDTNVQPRQAAAFYAALRRLQKEQVMLLYPSEGHVLNSPKNQEDLTHKIKDWLGYYLQGEVKKEWMKSDGER
ncbi:alpha/beta hydrolase family protein [Flavobacterium sp. HJJ]|uniref:alpha/beta hydrolase family protein n=1 Tax=Flavobacterium sp. HJJ TaxID=2783792 RepID=UPI00188B2DBF|nr:prolyl oligopeptidase family serine peptidase [Flavobacterium sp. HJJ]MBF4473065.1 prolyl oligopeptidase family serine peptidase [Flavobacterium sp. HJJ]